MAENSPLRECPVCGAIGLSERIDGHDCPTFLEWNERTSSNRDRGKSRNCVVAHPRQVLEGYPLSISEAIACTGCECSLTEGIEIAVLAYRPHWSETWAITTVRCVSCDFDSAQPVDRSGEYLLASGRIATRCDAPTQSYALVFSKPAICGHRTIASESSDRSGSSPTIEGRTRKPSSVSDGHRHGC
jgi:hypothetical protein